MARLGFDGRVAIVTGGGRGVGREHALLLASRGARVIVNDAGVDIDGRGFSDEYAKSVVKEITAAGGMAVPNTDDVRHVDAGKNLVEQALDEFGRLDILINNAGNLCAGALSEQSDYDLTATVEIHLYGTARLTHAAWPHLVKAGYGRIVNTTSSTVFGIPEHSYYGAAKAGIFGLTRSLALEGAAHGVQVNAIAPTAWTRMAISSAGDALSTPELLEYAQRAMPVGPNAALAGFLAHDSCSLTGEVLCTAGGRVARWVLAETEGIEVGADLKPEDVADQLDAINRTDTLHQFKSGIEELAYTQQKLLARG